MTVLPQPNAPGMAHVPGHPWEQTSAVRKIPSQTVSWCSGTWIWKQRCGTSDNLDGTGWDSSFLQLVFACLQEASQNPPPPPATDGQTQTIVQDGTYKGFSPSVKELVHSLLWRAFGKHSNHRMRWNEALNARSGIGERGGGFGTATHLPGQKGTGRPTRAARSAAAYLPASSGQLGAGNAPARSEASCIPASPSQPRSQAQSNSRTSRNKLSCAFQGRVALSPALHLPWDTNHPAPGITACQLPTTKNDTSTTHRNTRPTTNNKIQAQHTAGQRMQLWLQGRGAVGRRGKAERLTFLTPPNSSSRTLSSREYWPGGAM